MSLNSNRQEVKKSILWSICWTQNLRRKFKGLNIKKGCIKRVTNGTGVYKNSVYIFLESRNRPGVAQRVPGGLGSQISMTFST